MPPTTSSAITDQLTSALGGAVIRIWRNLPQDVQDHLFKEAVASQGESTQLAVFLHDKHTRTAANWLFWRGETGAAWIFHGSDGSAGAPWLSTRLCRCGLAFTPFVSG